MADFVDRARSAVTDRAELPGMSLMEHLAELRKRLINATIYLLIGFAVAYAFHERLYGYIQKPLTDLHIDLNFTHPTDPLNLYLRSLDALATIVADDVLALPGHGLPFRGVPARIKELKTHHAARCGQIGDACRETPQSVAALVPLLFPKALDPQQTSFAFSEILAHVNYMLRRKELAKVEDSAGMIRFSSRL